eukprot:TRINITY_DN7562_c0_g1_i1.p1 TRINITY_DN7562_c0_g1~~TRINITY_DN7562_c0_g1_i1.p1  ORF type:complete len:377 (-),score=78.74 TRINITY_DN7562_c0_g1_i1:173-1153(-)
MRSPQSAAPSGYYSGGTGYGERRDNVPVNFTAVSPFSKPLPMTVADTAGGGADMSASQAPMQTSIEPSNAMSANGAAVTPMPTWKPRYALSRYSIAFMQLLGALDVVTDILKVVKNGDAAADAGMEGWARATVGVGVFLIFFKLYSHIYVMLLAKSADEKGDGFNMCLNRPGCACGCLPFTVVMLPFASLLHRVYRGKSDHFHDPAAEHASLDIFVRRPLSTVILGIPVYSVFGSLIFGDELLMHPAIVHNRTMLTVMQNVLEDIPSIVIDALVVLAAKPGVDVRFFWISFGYSIFNLLVHGFVAAAEVIQHERNVTEEHPEKDRA